jgi:hypothetical protein
MARRREERKGFLSTKNIIGIFIVAIMVLSGVGYMWDRNTSTNEYQGHKFSQTTAGWVTTIDGKQLTFSFYPDDLSHLNLSSDAAQYLSSVKMFYIVFDPNDSLVPDFEVARMSLENELPLTKGIYPTTAVTAKDSVYAAFPIASCANATILVPVVYLKSGESTQIIEQGPCIILVARDSYDVPVLIDRLRYGLYGIM